MIIGRPRIAGVLLALGLVAIAGAETPTGTAQLSGKASVAVRGCGADRDPSFSATVTWFGDGTWKAADSEADLFGGTWTSVGAGGRTLDLFFDAETEADLISTIAEDVGVLCDLGSVTVTSSVRKLFTLKLNRAATKAKVVLRYVFKGHAGNRTGSAKYRVRAKGAFAPAA